jgi:transglutaminase-like putative cysteine protease
MFSTALVMAARRNAAFSLESIATQGARSPRVQQLVHQASQLLHESFPNRLWDIWQWLPTLYVQDRDGDHWQSAEETLRLKQGDCEDWSVLLGAVLKAFGIDAHLAVMPQHAAVFVPIVPVSANNLLAALPNMVPRSWRTAVHRGRLWLPLEATTTPGARREPGVDDRLIRPWLGTDELIIAHT